MAQQGENGNGRVLWWAMGIFAALVTFGVTAWVSRAEAAFERSSATEGSVQLLTYRLSELERSQRETNEVLKEAGENLRVVRRLLEERR